MRITTAFVAILLLCSKTVHSQSLTQQPDATHRVKDDVALVAVDSSSVPAGPARSDRFDTASRPVMASRIHLVAPKKRPVLEGAVLGFTLGFLAGALVAETSNSSDYALLSGLGWGIIGAGVGAGIGAMSR